MNHPAFPRPASEEEYGDDGRRQIRGAQKGMSVREYFAAQALIGLLAQTTYTESGYPTPVHDLSRGEGPEIAAAEAVTLADALLAELAKNGGRS